MWAVYKKEVRSYLTSMTGYIFMAVLLAVTGLYYAANCLVGGYPIFGAVLSSVLFILLILIPVLTMRSISEEKKQKTDQLLLTAPVSIFRIVFGKYFAMLTVFLIPVLMICLFPLILMQFGKVSLPMAYTAILGFLLYGAACLAIGLFLSALTESQVIAAVMTFGVLFLFHMASGIASLISSNGIVGEVLTSLSFYARFTNFVQGILDLTGVVYFLSVVVLFLILTIQLLHKKHGSYRVSMVILACAIVLVVNMTMEELPSGYLKYDVSQQKLFTTGEQTEEIVKGLTEDVTLYLVAQEGGEDATLLELLERYENLSSYIHVETKDPVVYPNFVAQYGQQQVTDNSIIAVGAQRSKIIDYYDIYQYDFDYYSYSSSLSAFDGEGQITSAIAYVTSSEIPVLYTLTGHNEGELSSSMVSSIEKENVEIRSLNLLTSAGVPEDAEILLIYAPLADISAEEKEKILTYMEDGGKVIMLTCYSEEDTPNLDSLLLAYGLERAEGMVLEGRTDHYLPNYPYYLLPDIGYSEITQNVSERYVLMAFAQGILQTEERKDTLEMESLLTTTDEAYSKINLQSEHMGKEEEDTDGPFDVGVSVTDTETGARLLYFSTEYLLDAQADSMVSGANSALFMGAVSSLAGHESTVSIEAKNVAVEYLTATAGSAVFWGLLLVIVLPLALLITGGIIWFRRRKR